MLGAAGVLLDQPGLKGAGVGLVAHEKGARIVVRSELDPKAKRPQTFKPFEPALQDADAQGRARLPGRERALHCAEPRARGGGAADRQPRRAAAAGGRQLDQQSGGRLTREVLAALQGEVAVTLTAAVPAPVLTVVANAKKDTAQDARAARASRSPACSARPRASRA